MPYIESSRNLIWHYQLQGEGKPVLFIHGWAGDLNIWQQQIDFFSSGYKTIALDLPGHGKSSWKKSNLEELSTDMDFILEKIKIEKVNLVAVSFGGLLALKFAQMFPQRLEHLILVDTAAKFVSSNKEEGITTLQIKRLAFLLDWDLVGALNIFLYSLFSEEDKKMSSFKKVWEILTCKVIFPQKEALKEFLTILEKEDLAAILPQIKAKTLIVSGKKDYICPALKAKELRNKIPRACLRLIEDSGHLPFLTQPDIFNRILEDFMVNEKVS